jgi:hypothetical protein
MALKRCTQQLPVKVSFATLNNVLHVQIVYDTESTWLDAYSVHFEIVYQ